MKKLFLIFLILLNAQFVFGEASRSFDGANDEITAGDVLDVTTGNVSICAWGKTTEDASADFLIGKDSGGAGLEGYAIRQETDDLFDFIIDSDATDITQTSTTDCDGIWCWVCGTFSTTSDITVIYINGVSEGTTDSSSVGTLTNVESFKVGEDGGEFNDYTGLITYGKQFTAVLTVVEVNELMWRPEMVVIATPNIFWPLWGDSTEIDLSGNGLTGTPTGTTASTDGPPVMIGDAPV